MLVVTLQQGRRMFHHKTSKTMNLPTTSNPSSCGDRLSSEECTSASTAPGPQESNSSRAFGESSSTTTTTALPMNNRSLHSILEGLGDGSIASIQEV
jgi:hypothetical protein